jgi:hypothetical protein
MYRATDVAQEPMCHQDHAHRARCAASARVLRADASSVCWGGGEGERRRCERMGKRECAPAVRVYVGWVRENGPVEGAQGCCAWSCDCACVARRGAGAIARLGARLERARLRREEADRFASEQHAVAVAADVARKEILLYLAAGKVCVAGGGGW